jgi:hypothetical protein
MDTPQKRMPLWVPLIIAGLAAIEPVLHVWIPACPPEDTVHSGLHTLDTYAYMTAFQHYGDGFYSPYAACGGLAGDRSPTLYSLPHHHLYGLAGMAGYALGVPPFLWLGLVNGLGVALMLFAAWVLLRTAVPALAARAFLLYALGGGLGGVAYATASALGLQQEPGFEKAFLRLFLYQLNEGASFQPWLLAARFYYTLPLALGFGALAATVRGAPAGHRGLLAMAVAAQFAAAFLNMRLGPVMLLGGVLFLTLAPAPLLRRAGAGMALTLATGAGVGGAYAMLQTNPELQASVFQSLGSVMWLLPFLYATVLLLPWAVFSLGTSVITLPPVFRALGCALAGYAVAYALLYLGYLAYYGGLVHGGDTSAALFASDPALLGAALGGVAALFAGKAAFRPGEDFALGWWTLWLLALFCGAVSAMGQGWFMQFMPQRLSVGIGLPLAVLAAAGAHQMAPRIPRLTRAWMTLIVTCGIVSASVTWGWAYGPLGWEGIQKTFPWTRYAYITLADDALLDRVDTGTLLAPSLGNPLFGDVAVQRAGLRTVYGNGTMDFTREIMPEVRARVARFFGVDATVAERRELLQDWRVTHVLCPDTAPVDPAVIGQLRAMPGLEVLGEQGGGVLFRVLP